MKIKMGNNSRHAGFLFGRLFDCCQRLLALLRIDEVPELQDHAVNE